MGQIAGKLKLPWTKSDASSYTCTLPTALPPEMLFLDFLTHRELERCRQLSAATKMGIDRHRHLLSARPTYQMLRIKLLDNARLTTRHDGTLDGRHLGGRNNWMDISRATLCCKPLTRQMRNSAALIGHRLFIGAPPNRIVWLEVLSINGNNRSEARIKRNTVVLAVRNELDATTAPAIFHFLKHLDGARFLDVDLQRAQQHTSARINRAVFSFTAAFSPRPVELHCQASNERPDSLGDDVRQDLAAILRLSVVNYPPQQVQDEGMMSADRSLSLSCACCSVPALFVCRINTVSVTDLQRRTTSTTGTDSRSRSSLHLLPITAGGGLVAS